MTRPLLSLPLRAALLAIVAVSGPAAAQIHFTTPVPTFEQALAQARQAGKPLVLELSATWCGPCKLMARDLAKPRAQPVLEPLHLVVYDGSDDETGQAVMARLGANAFPTLVVFDPDGQEVVRKEGYGRWPDMEGWLKELPEQAVSLAQLKASADAAPKDAKLQLALAARLVAAERYAEARPYYERGRRLGSREQQAAAAWALLQLDAVEGERRAARAHAEKLAAAYPGSKEAGSALRFLASLQPPPTATLEALFAKHFLELKDAGRINGAIFAALKGGAYKAAALGAAKLTPLAGDNPGYLDTLAEVAFLAEHDSDKAIALEGRAIEAADPAARAGYQASLERYRRNQGEPGEDLLNFRPPRITPEPPRRPTPRTVTPYKLMSRVGRQIRDSCWQHAVGAADSTTVLVVAGATPAAHRALFAAATPPAWAACALKLIRSVELPEGEIFSLHPDLTPLSMGEQLDAARLAAEDGCRAQAGKLKGLTLALAAEPGKPPTLAFGRAHGKPVPPELAACIEQRFAGLKLPRPLIDTVSLSFSDE